MPDFAASFGSWPAVTLLVATRLAALLLMTPLLQAVPVPVTVRVLLVLGLSACLALPLSSGSAWQPQNLRDFIPALAGEACMGAAMGLGVLAAFAAISVAARLIDVQVGFGIGQVFDPVTHRPVPVLGSLLTTMAVLVFFLLDGHHALLRGVAVSLQHVPAGTGWTGQTPGAHVLQGMSSMFAAAFSLAAPIVLCLLLVDLAFGAVARNLPQFNLLILGTPAKIAVGLLVLSVWASLWSSGAGRAQTRAFQDWGTLIERSAVQEGTR
jgi:flagellar biosynthetic protein FliR